MGDEWGMRPFQRNLRRNIAFSLVEMAIVISVIALIIGGSLVGMSIVHTAQLRSVLEEQSTYFRAIELFKIKYMALPGDMPNATSVWTTAGGDNLEGGTCENLDHSMAYGVASTKTCNGNGDGVIGNAANSANQGAMWMLTQWGPYEEGYLAWNQLGLSGLISGSYAGTACPVMPPGTPANLLNLPFTTGPMEAVGVNMPVAKSFPGAGWNVTFQCITADAGHTFPICSHVMVFGGRTNIINLNFLDRTLYPVITGIDALSLDSKIDDGIPGTGNVMALPNGGYYAPNCTTTNSALTSRYVTTNNNIACSLFFLVGF